MKQLLFLLLFPCLALAQYPGNGNQKISLGEQTTADGLVYRGIRADTASKIVPFSDTSAYIILDTVEKTLWLYKAGQVPNWQQVGGSAGGGGTVTSITGGTGLTGGTITTSGTLAADTSFLFTQSDTLSLNLTNRFAAKQNNITLTTTGTSGAATLVNSTLNIPQYSGGGGVTDGDKGDIDVTNSGATWTIDTSAISLSGNKVTGTLPVANGGTNAGAFTSGSVVFAGASGTYTQDNSNLFWNNSTKRLGLGTNTPSETFHASGGAPAFRFSSSTYGDGDTYIGNTGQYGTYIGDGRSIAGNFTGQAATIKRHAVVFGFGGSFTESFYVSNFPSGILTYRLVLDTTGKFAIGLRYPTEKLHVEGNARITGAYSVTTGSAANVFVTTDGVLQRSTSSIKYKTDVEDYSKGLKEVMQLRPVTFKSINSNNDKTYAGFIAEELADLKLNELVENNDSGEPDAISYAYMVTLLTKAIQEQQEQISLLKKRLLILENK